MCEFRTVLVDNDWDSGESYNDLVELIGLCMLNTTPTPISQELKETKKDLPDLRCKGSTHALTDGGCYITSSGEFLSQKEYLEKFGAPCTLPNEG